MGRAVRRPKRLPFPADRQVAHAEASIGISRASRRRGRREAAWSACASSTRASAPTPSSRRFIDGRNVRGHRRQPDSRCSPCGSSAGTSSRRRAPDHDRPRKVEHQLSEEVRRDDRPRRLAAGRPQKLHHLCKRAYRTLDLSGYARLDLRMDNDGRVARPRGQPNPQLAYGEDFAESAEHGGVSYEQLLQKIINYGLSGDRKGRVRDSRTEPVQGSVQGSRVQGAGSGFGLAVRGSGFGFRVQGSAPGSRPGDRDQSRRTAHPETPPRRPAGLPRGLLA